VEEEVGTVWWYYSLFLFCGDRLLPRNVTSIGIVGRFSFMISKLVYVFKK